MEPERLPDGLPQEVDIVDMVRTWYSSLDLGLDHCRALTPADFELVTPEHFPGGGKFVGAQIFDAFLPALFARFAELRTLPDEFHRVGETVVALGAYVGRTKSGADFNARFCHVWRIQDGKPQRMRQFTDTAAFQAALKK